MLMKRDRWGDMATGAARAGAGSGQARAAGRGTDPEGLATAAVAADGRVQQGEAVQVPHAATRELPGMQQLLPCAQAEKR